MLPDKLENETSEKDHTRREVHLWPEGETVTDADLKAITDAHAEALLRNSTPGLTSSEIRLARFVVGVRGRERNVRTVRSTTPSCRP